MKNKKSFKILCLMISLAMLIGCNEDNLEENCSDSIQNQDETGIDCGGVCDECETTVDKQGMTLSRIDASTDDQFGEATYQYDNQGRVIKLTYSTTIVSMTSNTLINYVYDGDEIMPSLIIDDEATDTTYVVYDELNRVVWAKDSYDGSVQTITYTNDQILVSNSNYSEVDTFILENGNIIQSNYDYVSLVYKYDDKLNPFKSFTLNSLFAPYFESILTDNAPFRYGVGHNNNLFSQIDETNSNEASYSYIYNSENFPTKCTLEFSAGPRVITYEYTYR